MPDNIKENLDIRPVKWIDEVLAIALERLPEPLDDDAYLAGSESIGQGDETGPESRTLIGPDPTDFKRFSVDRTRWQE